MAATVLEADEQDLARLLGRLNAHPVIEGLRSMRIAHLDLSSSNARLQALPKTDSVAMTRFIDDELRLLGADAGVGGYDEDRTWYQRSPHFAAGTGEFRSVHLGVDIWVPEGTAVLAPIDGEVHSFRDNANYGDYGPTIVLVHQVGSSIFHTLYGHLDRASLESLVAGRTVRAGERIGAIGGAGVNGDWPPHLHFQIIADMEGLAGDYPGVATKSERARYLANCPDPNLLLGLKELR